MKLNFHASGLLMRKRPSSENIYFSISSLITTLKKTIAVCLSLLSSFTSSKPRNGLKTVFTNVNILYPSNFGVGSYYTIIQLVSNF